MYRYKAEACASPVIARGTTLAIKLALVGAIIAGLAAVAAATTARADKARRENLIATIRTFLRTDVCRQLRFCLAYDPVVGYRVVAPELRGGESLAEWRTGNIPVAPCDYSRVKIRRVTQPGLRPLFAVALHGVPAGSCGDGWVSFFLELRSIRGNWRVSYWGPSPV